jgi:hypothetical protein
MHCCFIYIICVKRQLYIVVLSILSSLRGNYALLCYLHYLCAFKSSEESRKVYQLTNDDVCKYDLDTYMVLSNSVNYDYCKHKHIYTALFQCVVV